MDDLRHNTSGSVAKPYECRNWECEFLMPIQKNCCDKQFNAEKKADNAHFAETK